MTSQTIKIFGDIGYAVTAESVSQQLGTFDRAAPVSVEINSDGGSVMEAAAIFAMLRTWPAGVVVEIVGWALSAASVIAMAGRKIRAHDTAMLMVHAPSVGTEGNAGALRQLADTLDKTSETMLLAYSRTRQSDAVIRGWLDGSDHWFTAAEALQVGLVDEVLSGGGVDAPQFVQAVLASCRHPIPSNVKARLNAMIPNSNPMTPGAVQQPNAASMDQVRAEALRADQQRRAQIRAEFASLGDRLQGASELQRACEDDLSCTPRAAGERILAAMARGVTPAGGFYVARDGDMRFGELRAAATDVLLMRAGIRVSEPHPAARDLQRMSIVAIAERFLSMTGVSVSQKSKADIITAALSTSDFPQLLSGVASKALRDGYESSPSTFRAWTGEREVQDFKQNTLVALSEAPGLQEVREGGEYKFGVFAESGSTFKLATFGRIVNITRQALVNDDTDAFTRIPQAFGAAALRLEADTVYSLLTSNPVLGDSIALFDAQHGNVSAASSITVASLGDARAKMRLQKGLQGLGYVDPQPRYLITPVKLETSAEILLNSLVDPSKSNNTGNLEWIRGLELIADPRLDAVSETAWYLSAAPTQMEGIVRAYLAGVQRPELETEAGFTRDVVGNKVRLDMAAGVVDFRALHKVG